MHQVKPIAETLVSSHLRSSQLQVNHHSTTDVWKYGSFSIFRATGEHNMDLFLWLYNFNCGPGTGMQTAKRQKAPCLLMPSLCFSSCLLTQTPYFNRKKKLLKNATLL